MALCHRAGTCECREPEHLTRESGALCNAVQCCAARSVSLARVLCQLCGCTERGAARSLSQERWAFSARGWSSCAMLKKAAPSLALSLSLSRLCICLVSLWRQPMSTYSGIKRGTPDHHPDTGPPGILHEVRSDHLDAAPGRPCRVFLAAAKPRCHPITCHHYPIKNRRLQNHPLPMPNLTPLPPVET